MGIVLDLILLAIVVITAVISAKRGFVKIVIETAGIIAAVILAFTLSTPLASATYDKVIEPQLIKAVKDNADGADTLAWESLPNFLTENSEKLGISVSEFSEKINANLSNGINSAVATASQEVVKPITVQIIGMLYSVILFILLSIIVKFLSNFLNKLFSFSVVGSLNRTLGGILGICKGAIFAALFCIAVCFIVYVSKNGFLIFNEENIELSYIFKFIKEKII